MKNTDGASISLSRIRSGLWCGGSEHKRVLLHLAGAVAHYTLSFTVSHFCKLPYKLRTKHILLDTHHAFIPRHRA
jgi:hypothetical protein